MGTIPHLYRVHVGGGMLDPKETVSVRAAWYTHADGYLTCLDNDGEPVFSVRESRVRYIERAGADDAETLTDLLDAADHSPGRSHARHTRSIIGMDGTASVVTYEVTARAVQGETATESPSATTTITVDGAKLADALSPAAAERSIRTLRRSGFGIKI